MSVFVVFFFQAEDGIRDYKVTGVQTCALPISTPAAGRQTSSADMATWLIVLSWSILSCRPLHGAYMALDRCPRRTRNSVLSPGMQTEAIGTPQIVRRHRAGDGDNRVVSSQLISGPLAPETRYFCRSISATWFLDPAIRLPQCTAGNPFRGLFHACIALLPRPGRVAADAPRPGPGAGRPPRQCGRAPAKPQAVSVPQCRAQRLGRHVQRHGLGSGSAAGAEDVLGRADSLQLPRGRRGKSPGIARQESRAASDRPA